MNAYRSQIQGAFLEVCPYARTPVYEGSNQLEMGLGWSVDNSKPYNSPNLLTKQNDACNIVKPVLILRNI